jgi:hypothetical protein
MRNCRSYTAMQKSMVDLWALTEEHGKPVNEYHVE